MLSRFFLQLLGEFHCLGVVVIIRARLAVVIHWEIRIDEKEKSMQDDASSEK